MKFPSVPWNKFLLILKKFKFNPRGKALRLSALFLLLGLSGYIFYLDSTIRVAFDGRKFALPARVYGRALEVYPGVKLTPAQFAEELKALGYHERPEPNDAATYKYTLKGLEFTTRDFVFWDGPQAAQRLSIEFDDGKVSLLRERGSREHDVPLLRLEPPVIGGIYPGHNEDRALVRLDQVPKPLIAALIAIEDRKFYTHSGIDPRGIARALFKTVSLQRIEGGSTLTQQLVKNFFLTPERTLTRKANEVLMSVLLELHYGKDEILETYLNEIYLGQDSSRAIHGVGLASHFYFDKPLDKLELHEVATLVGMVKGPSVYDPRKKPELVLQRRNIVLQEMVHLASITQAQFVEARQKPLGVIQRAPGSLVKPIVYLTALENHQRYTLLTPLDDSPLVWRQRGTDDWKPQNYDRKFHGQVPLHTALAQSYNVSTARLGIKLGIERILDKLPRFGIDRRPPPFASALLGAFELSPYEIAQLYQTFADGGFRTPLRGIREIVTADGKPLQRYPLNVEQVAEAAPVYLLTAALQGVVREGTGLSLSNWLPADLNVAGKTGTTDDLRDSWFAGYTGDMVAVVWVGRDDNKSTGLTGASGAMTVWGEMMKNNRPEPLQPAVPEDIELVNIDLVSGQRVTEECNTALLMPFYKGTAPTASTTTCAGLPAVVQKADDKPVAKAKVKPEAKSDAKPEAEKKSWLQRLLN